MKPSSAPQIPRRASSSSSNSVSHGGRQRETPPPSTHQPKIICKSSIPAFSAAPEEILTESDDLLVPSSVPSNAVEDPKQSPIWQPVTEVLALKGPAVAVVTKAAEEEIVDRLREALLEVGKSTAVSGVSKELLGVLVEAVISEVGADPCERHGRLDLAFWEKARIWIVCFLILVVAVMDLLVLSAMFIGGGGRDLSSLPPPT